MLLQVLVLPLFKKYIPGSRWDLFFLKYRNLQWQPGIFYCAAGFPLQHSLRALLEGSGELQDAPDLPPPWLLHLGRRQPLPVVPFLGQQLLELSQCHHAPFDEGAVGDRLSAEVVSNHDVLTRLGRAAARSLLGLQPVAHK